MKHYKFILPTLLFTLISPLTVSCASETTPTPINLQINGGTRVGINEYLNLSATVNDTKHDVVWQSSNKAIATVSSTGIVKGMSLGTVTITAISLVDNTVKASTTIEVIESMQLGNVFERFTKSNYQVKMNGQLQFTDPLTLTFDAVESYYENSYYFEAKSDIYSGSYGYGNSLKGCFIYSIDNSQVSYAELLRTEIYSYEELLYGLHDLLISSYKTISLAEDHVYDISNSELVGLFYSIAMQNLDLSKYSAVISSVYSNLQPVNLVITSPYSFEVELKFSAQDYNFGSIKLSFEIDDEKENTILNNFLNNNQVTYPQVYEDITKISNLLASHNYTRDLGNYTKADGSSFPIGKCYYTENYVYFDFSDEYLNEIPDLYDYGYVNIASSTKYTDGVYEFKYAPNDNNEMILTILEQYKDKDSKGNTYLKYYDFYENASLVFEQMNSKLYSFALTSTSDYDASYSQYLSDNSVAASLAEALFTDYVTAFDATSEGMIISVKYDDSNPSNSFLNYGIIMSISGAVAYVYSDYPYTAFNTSSVQVMEDFLQNLN